MTNPVSGGVPEPLNDQADELLSDVEEYGHLGADFSKRATAILKALAALKYSDVAALGGVPEQGLRDALVQIAELRDWPVGADTEPDVEFYKMRLQRAQELARAALERPRHALPAPEPTAFCVQCGFAQMDTTRVLDGQTVPAPWQVDQCGAAWSDVYNAANSVCANWLTEGHATPALSRHLQTLSTALMILDQKRVMAPTPMDGDTFTWKERADKAEAELELLRGTALPAEPCPNCGHPGKFWVPAEHAPPEPSKEAIAAAWEANARCGVYAASKEGIAAGIRAAYAVDCGRTALAGRGGQK